MPDDTHNRGPGCPAPPQLTQFLLGALPESHLQRLADHIDSCPQCLARIDSLGDASDPLIARLREPEEGEVLTPEECDRAVRLVDRLLSSGTRPTLSGSRSLETLGQYDLLEQLGEGGMGTVYRARHRLMNKVVALKVIQQHRAQDQLSLERFQREILALARLDHPHIVRAQYADQVDGTLFLVMDHVPGVTLSAQVRRQGPLPVAQACAFIHQAALGLQHAHEQGLVHRDVKPSNLLLTPDGVVKVLDLGLALCAPGSSDQPERDLTAPGQVLGTYDYMAPEQWESHEVDGRADVYSLGCTLYFLLTGQPPFGGDHHATRASKMKAHVLETPPSVSITRPDVPALVEVILQKMLAKNPADRYQTPGEGALALASVAEVGRNGDSASRTPLVGAKLVADPRPGPRRLLWAGCVALLAVAAIGAWGVSHWTGYFPNDSHSRTTPAPLADTSSAPAGDLLEVDFFRVQHFRLDGDTPVRQGELGDYSQGARVKDDLRIEARFKAPAHAYLIAFYPNGKDEVLSPEQKEAFPEKAETFTSPIQPSDYWSCDDGLGLQALILVASRKPLPRYDVWRAAVGAPRWRPTTWEQSWGVWSFDGKSIKLLERQNRFARRPRGLVFHSAASVLISPTGGIGGLPWESWREVGRDGPAARLAELVEFFRDRPDLEVVRALAFPVGPASED